MPELKKKGNTKVSNVDGIIVVRFHNTDIVTVTPHEIILKTQGFYTATTKQRMNQASQEFDLGFSVYQKAFVWRVDYKGKTYLFGVGNEARLPRGN